MAGGRGRLDAPTVVLHDLAGKAQPNARPTLLGREKGHEDLLHHL